jgi:hypothetical protein
MRRLLLLIISSLLPLASYGDEDSWLTRSGYYHVSYQSELRPIVINRIHTWIFHIETPDGAPVDEAEISVTGGMPLHNHGLPTAPQMTTSLGNGNYRVEGMRFHMNGDWELLVTVDVAGRRDTVIIPLTL